MDNNTAFRTMIFDCCVSIAVCSLLTIVYLASLHLWNSPYDRDHPSTMKKRFLSIFVMLFIAPCFLYVGLHKSILQKVSFWDVLGLRTEGLLPAVFIPLFLTMILFLGPISMELFSGIFKLYTEKTYWYSSWTNLIWIRSHVVSPISEEFTYRSCMLPLLLQSFPPATAILLNPLFFGVCFQCAYTTLFGAYSAYIFYRTGHFASIIIIHAFCNHMGFPDLKELISYETSRKVLVSCLFVLGFVAWCFLLRPLTEPSWYYNSPTWYTLDF